MRIFRSLCFRNIAFNKEIGEIYAKSDQSLELDEKLIKEEEKYDGYYAIVTSEADFLICFVSLVIARLLEFRLKRKYSVSKILKSLRRCECSLIDQNLYLFDYYDEVLRDVGSEVNIDFSKKYRTLQEIKKVQSEVKKQAR